MKRYAGIIGLVVLLILPWAQVTVGAEPENPSLASMTFYVH